MMALGWHVHTGTDAPIDLTAISVHMNLRAMTRFGIAPLDALLTATRHAGAFLHEPIGTIATGKLADLILVDGDPLARVEDLARVRLVIANGVPRDQTALIGPFAKAPSAMAPTAVREAAHHHHPYYWETAAYVEDGRSACCGGHSVAV
jgi:cytosine/adenosine deaminase-related metal-dependent hydrolase